MNRDRFLQILYYLQLTDSQNNTWNNKLFKLRLVLDYVVRSAKSTTTEGVKYQLMSE